jgi:hypothetical protein
MPDLLTPASEMPADEMAIAEARTRSRGELLDKLAQAINFTNTENASNTPDFILANFAAACLDAFAEASVAREAWYGKSLSIGGEASDIAAMEARTPAPALPADMEALLAEAECFRSDGTGRGIIASRLATALRETLSERDQMRESAQVGKDRWQDAAEQLAEAQAEREAERARAEKAEAENSELRERYLATAQLAALRKEAAEAIASAHYEGFVDGKQGAGNYSHYDTSAARRAAQRIGGAE